MTAYRPDGISECASIHAVRISIIAHIRRRSLNCTTTARRNRVHGDVPLHVPSTNRAQLHTARGPACCAHAHDRTDSADISDARAHRANANPAATRNRSNYLYRRSRAQTTNNRSQPANVLIVPRERSPMRATAPYRRNIKHALSTYSQTCSTARTSAPNRNHATC